MEYKGSILFKYGGNAMVNDQLQKEVIGHIVRLSNEGYRIVIVHGGGPFIREALERANIESEFVGGQRITSAEAISYVEMALKGMVNGRLISLLTALGKPAVGLSGKDGRMVTGRKRFHEFSENGQLNRVDMGYVADVHAVDTTLPNLLLDHGYIPVIACLATNADGASFNVNADMFAGHMAGALGVDKYVVLTDVDGLLADSEDPGSIIRELSVGQIDALKASGVVRGGMIPKLDSCAVALQKGARSAMIVNGTKPKILAELYDTPETGTMIHR